MTGVLVIDKQAGPSSFDVVRDVRRIFHNAKTGHAGSLDPFATGVLVLLLGKATKLSGALLNADKSYNAVAHLGVRTNSMDLTGQIIEEKPVPELIEGDISKVLRSFEGEWHQMPPMFSAKKQQGVRLYELARKNIEVERAPIPVDLYRVELKRWENPFLEFEVHCSKGTYIRALADEIGLKLGTVAHLKSLRRLACGPFEIGEAVTTEALERKPDEYVELAYDNYVRLLTQEGFGRPNPRILEDFRRDGFAKV